eukprot:3796463-Rhodomonas_salina.1
MVLPSYSESALEVSPGLRPSTRRPLPPGSGPGPCRTSAQACFHHCDRAATTRVLRLRQLLLVLVLAESPD